jgi:hypothetical protein
MQDRLPHGLFKRYTEAGQRGDKKHMPDADCAHGVHDAEKKRHQ